MKLTAICTVLLLAGLFVVGPKSSLEARCHNRNNFSLGLGFFPAYPRTYVVQQYPPAPAYVEQYQYPSGETVTVYRNPPPVQQVYVYPPRPSLFSAFSFGFNFR